MSDRSTLAAMGSIASLLCLGLPEREAHHLLYARTLDLVDALGETTDWPARYALWEHALLAEMGFGLDFSECAATGSTQDLIYVSPRSGRAVSREGGKDSKRTDVMDDPRHGLPQLRPQPGVRSNCKCTTESWKVERLAGR